MLTRGRLIFIALSLTTVFLVTGATLIAASEQQDPEDGDSPYKYLAVFMEVFNLVNKAYVDEPEVGQLMSGAFEGTFDALDPFSVYVPASALDTYRESSTIGSRRSGLLVLKERGVAFAMAVEDGSPAAEAGLERGDILATVDGVDTRTMPLFEVQRILAGEPGTEIRIERLRQGEKEQVDLKLAEYSRPAVILNAEEGIPVLRIPGFHDGVKASVERSLEALTRAVPEPIEAAKAESPSEAAAASDSAEAPGDPEAPGGSEAPGDSEAIGEPSFAQTDRLLIDLRGVAGGDPAVAYAIAGLFADGELGTLRRRQEDVEVFEDGAGAPWQGRIAVLTDRGTQGAAEILIAVLKQSQDAALIGEPTFGHSGVLEAVSLSDGGQLMITSAFYTGPDRAPLAEEIEPDVRVRAFSRVDDDGLPIDPVLERGVKFLLEEEEVEEKAAA
ncbi:MAG: S41 family peptidase [Acidobacteriota bacterium]